MHAQDERERVKKCGARVLSMDQISGMEPIHENWGNVRLGAWLHWVARRWRACDSVSFFFGDLSHPSLPAHAALRATTQARISTRRGTLPASGASTASTPARPSPAHWATASPRSWVSTRVRCLPSSIRLANDVGIMESSHTHSLSVDPAHLHAVSRDNRQCRRSRCARCRRETP